MTLREYVQRVPWCDGRLPLFPNRRHPKSLRWLIPGGPDGYWYCDALRRDIFWIPDTLDAMLLLHHLAPYDPYDRTTTETWRYDAAAVHRLAARHEREAAPRFAQWMADGRFPLADDSGDETLPVYA